MNVVDGNWSPWMTISSCSVTCGNGMEIRQRFCDDPSPSLGGSECTLSDDENTGLIELDPMAQCNDGSCPIPVVSGKQKHSKNMHA